MAFLFTWVVSTVIAMAILMIIYTFYMSSQHGVFRRLGIPGPKPILVFGNFYHVLKMGITKYYMENYQRYRNSKVFGHFEGMMPTLVIRDLDMIRDICVRHFSNFPNRRTLLFSPPMDNMLNMIKDDHWKNVRATMSPTFSTGKLRGMTHHVIRSSQQLKKNLLDKQKRAEMVDLKHIMSCYTMDVIAATGFGVQVDSLKDKGNDFVVAAREIMDSLTRVFITTFLFPFSTSRQLSDFGLDTTSRSAINVFKRFVDEALNWRRNERDEPRRTDFLQLMVEASERIDEADVDGDGNNEADEEMRNLRPPGGRMPLSHEDIQAQAMIFILAGFETTSTALSFALFLLANHPETCKRVQDEIEAVLGSETPNYLNIQNLTYMEMCLYETMRLYPRIIYDRVCKEEIEIGGVVIPQGMTVQFPVYAIHHDPEIWPYPEEFIPERFSAENRAGRHPCAFLGFGQGPRNCIGSRLALLEMKIGLAAILQEMTPVRCAKTVYPPKLKDINLTTEDGLWVKMEERGE